MAMGTYPSIFLQFNLGGQLFRALWALNWASWTKGRTTQIRAMLVADVLKMERPTRILKIADFDAYDSDVLITKLPAKTLMIRQPRAREDHCDGQNRPHHRRARREGHGSRRRSPA